MLKKALLAQLSADILNLQGIKPVGHLVMDPHLGPLNRAFPFRAFPTGAIHELLASTGENMAASYGFLSALLSTLLGKQGMLVWVSAHRLVFPPALKGFGIEPSHVLFVEVPHQREAMWAMEEALKSEALTAVVCEMHDLGFTASKRLQLAVERSKVTGFILRSGNNLNPTACVSRWRIHSMPSDALDGLPGIGVPQWRVELLRMRNGKTGVWNLQWRHGRFEEVSVPSAGTSLITKAG